LGAIKRLFRDAVKTLTCRATGKPPPRRRRDETGKAFGQAKAALRRAARVPEGAYAVGTEVLIGTLDCLNPWLNEADNCGNLDEDCDNTDKNHPSLHL
jgi:hypothetical protein